MRLKKVLIVVKDAEKAKDFYCRMFGLSEISNNGENIILTEGLVLQEESIWKRALGKDVIRKNNACELYFEETAIDEFANKLKEEYPLTEYVTELSTECGEQRVMRFYDPDGNLIEVKEPFR